MKVSIGGKSASKSIGLGKGKVAFVVNLSREAKDSAEKVVLEVDSRQKGIAWCKETLFKASPSQLSED
jgi:hypothetical protein